MPKGRRSGVLGIQSARCHFYQLVRDFGALDYSVPAKPLVRRRSLLWPTSHEVELQRFLLAEKGAQSNELVSEAPCNISGATCDAFRGISVALTIGVPAFAQNEDTQQRFAAVKQAMAENKERLQQYQWIETTQLTLKVTEATYSDRCQYGPAPSSKDADWPSAQQPSGGDSSSE